VRTGNATEEVISLKRFFARMTALIVLSERRSA
jgi:hypothetical protein